MTRLVDMAELRELLGLHGRDTRALVRRLRAIAAERSPGAFPFFRLAGRWTIPRATLLELVPELAGGEEELGALVARQAAEIAALRTRVDELERRKPTIVFNATRL